MADYCGKKPNRLLTPEEVADKLRVKVSWVRERTRQRCPKDRQVPHIKLGKYVRFSEHLIEEWIGNGCQAVETKRIY